MLARKKNKARQFRPESTVSFALKIGITRLTAWLMDTFDLFFMYALLEEIVYDLVNVVKWQFTFFHHYLLFLHFA